MRSSSPPSRTLAARPSHTFNVIDVHGESSECEQGQDARAGVADDSGPSQVAIPRRWCQLERYLDPLVTDVVFGESSGRHGALLTSRNSPAKPLRHFRTDLHPSASRTSNSPVLSSSSECRRDIDDTLASGDQLRASSRPSPAADSIATDMNIPPSSTVGSPRRALPMKLVNASFEPHRDTVLTGRRFVR